MLFYYLNHIWLFIFFIVMIKILSQPKILYFEMGYFLFKKLLEYKLVFRLKIIPKYFPKYKAQ